MKFHLSIVLDKDGNNRYDLYSTNTLRELDEYIKGFSSSEEVRDKYNEEVSEFLLDNMGAPVRCLIYSLVKLQTW